ncbi:MAG: response regulator transcription factor, partial [Anaerolineales bacterium]
VLMDMYLTGSMDGIATTRAIRERCPQVQVLALSSFFEKGLVQGAMQAGAIGYLVKGVSGAELAEAIRAAYAGRPTLTSEAVEVLIEPTRPQSRLGHDLTERELEALALLVEGLSNAKIADRMYLSVAAVKYHVSNILSKLGAANRTEAVVLAMEHNLVPKSRK